MAGYVIPQAGHIVLSKGRPATPVVDIARVTAPKPVPVEAQAPFIPPKPVVPADFDLPAGRTFRSLMPIVVETTNLDALAILSPRKSADVVKARFILMWLTRKFTKLSLPAIGRRVSNRDHTTVLNACRRVEAVIAAHRVPFADCPRVMAERLWSLEWPKASAC